MSYMHLRSHLSLRVARGAGKMTAPYKIQPVTRSHSSLWCCHVGTDSRSRADDLSEQAGALIFPFEAAAESSAGLAHVPATMKAIGLCDGEQTLSDDASLVRGQLPFLALVVSRTAAIAS